MALEPGDIVDRYRIEGLLGEGGMSSVYLVRDPDDVRFALKVMAGHKSSLAERIRREGVVQSRLTHRHIVRAHDILEIGRTTALLLDYVPGPELGQIIDEGPLPLDEALTVFRAVGLALAHAHHQNFVHRDVKPGNVLLEVHHNAVVPRVADFGLVKALGGSLAGHATRTGAAMGTPAYMAPEQIADAKRVDRRADLWSLGCILYAMLRGQDPFQAQTVLHLFHQIATADYEPLRACVPDLPDRVHDAVEAMLQPEPTERVADVMDVLDYLEGHRDDLPIVDAHLQQLPPARPPGPTGSASVLAADTQTAARSRAGLAALERSVGDTVLPTTEVSRSPAPVGRAGRATWRVPLLLGLVGALALGGVGLAMVAWRLPGAPGGSEVPVASVPERPSPSPPPVAPPPTPPRPPAPEPEPEPEPEPVPDAEPAPAATPPSAPRPAPPSPRTTVTVEGADGLVFRGPDGEHEPPDVPPGTYQVEARFGARTVPVGQLTVPAGQVTVQCSRDMGRCAIP